MPKKPLTPKQREALRKARIASARKRAAKAKSKGAKGAVSRSAQTKSVVSSEVTSIIGYFAYKHPKKGAVAKKGPKLSSKTPHKGKRAPAPRVVKKKRTVETRKRRKK